LLILKATVVSPSIFNYVSLNTLIMTTEKLTFLQVLEKYLIYSEAFSQFNQLDEDDRKIIRPYIDSLKRQWEEELRCIRVQFHLPLAPPVLKIVL